MKVKQPLYLVSDTIFIIISLFLAFLLRFGIEIPLNDLKLLLFLASLVIAIKIALFSTIPFVASYGNCSVVAQGSDYYSRLTARFGIASPDNHV